ncbi:T4 family baseplate hub assembly chaperone [Saccharothrix sp. ST-888]|uniref:T4 family baseplate hub assembly chaperone n=1 Tax=Saccharothrix sp. ST-888 TaxID=1427391 RepID=UPI0005ECF792|nr:hypothetical protein [Saccharothrix sp. ST-888]KJK55518.1 hypothetical protein UK12_28035 [Saccharothrix sp. ST-888]
MAQQLPDFDSFGTSAISGHRSPEQAMAASQAVLAADRQEIEPQIAPPPDLLVELEQGILRDGRRLRDAEVRELTGEDEEALARIGTNWHRILDALILRGVRNVGEEPMSRKVADELLMGDREALILAVRRATFGDFVEFEGLPCPHCGEAVDLSLSLDDVPIVHLADRESTEFEVPLRKGATAVVRLPTGRDQNAVASLKDATTAQQNTEMLRRCLLRVESPDGGVTQGSLAVVRSMSMSDRLAVLEFMAVTQPGPRFNQVMFTHQTCGQEVPVPLSLAILFRGL